jgi:uncharacterized protein (PEP-CTERM system associated)
MATTTTDGFPDSERHRPSPLFISSAALAALFLAPAGNAAEWRIAPTLDLRETYTDNVRLAPHGSEKSDFVSDISPGVAVSANGRGLKLKANYAFQSLHYANDGKNSSSFHKLNADTNVDLIKDLFSFDGSASISQQSISLAGAQSTDNYAITDNRTTVRTTTASPYLHHEFHDIATTELRYTRTAVNTGSSAMSSSRNDGLRLTVNSGPSFRTLGWDASYSAAKNRMANSDAVNSSTVSGNLRYMLTPQFSLTGGAGYDKYDYLATAGTPSPAGKFYSGGFSWHPTERTSLAASVGHRFYGKTYSLDSSVRGRASMWRLSYDESITTALSQFAVVATASTSDFLNQLFRSSIPDDALRQRVVDHFILATGLPATLSYSINYLTNQFFLQKALKASVALTGAKNTLIFTAFSTSRQPQSVQNGTTSLAGLSPLTNGNTRQTGLNALWNWRVTALTSATLSADLTKSTLNLQASDQRIKTFRAAVARRLQPKLDGVIELKHATQTSDISANNYQENAISAFLSMKF